MVKGGSMAASSTAQQPTLSYSNSSSAGSTESFSSGTSFGDAESVTESITDQLEFIAADGCSPGEVREASRGRELGAGEPKDERRENSDGKHDG